LEHYKSVTGRKINKAGKHFLNNDGKLTDDHHKITDSLNNYFVTIADKINTNNANAGHSIESHTDKYSNYLYQAFMIPFPKIVLNHTSTNETENIIKSLKPKNSSGYDEIPVGILKSVRLSLAPINLYL
jgi:N-acetyl-beta-hexosaminidase